MKKRNYLIFLILATFLLLMGCQNSTGEKKELDELLTLKHELRFGEDGKFKYLILSDVQSGIFLEDEIVENIKIIVEREEPDLVIFGGDNSVNITSEEIMKDYLDKMVGYIESKKIPWAHIYGNHDSETALALSKEEQQEIYESYSYCVSKAGDTDLTGVGNYVLPILKSDDDTIGFNIWMLDSGTYLDPALPTDGIPLLNNDDYIHFDQIMWYYQTSELLEEYNKSEIPAMMMIHIPLQENGIAWNNRDSLEYEGERRSSGTGGSAINSGLFAAALDRGDVKMIVSAHVHDNDYAVEYAGIKLCASATIGTSSLTYHEPDMVGGRVVIVDQNNPENIETYMSYITE